MLGGGGAIIGGCCGCIGGIIVGLCNTLFFNTYVEVLWKQNGVAHTVFSFLLYILKTDL